MNLKTYRFTYLFLVLYLSNKAIAQRPPNLDLLFSRLKSYNSIKLKTYGDDSVATGVLGRLCWEYRLINMDSATCYCDEAIHIAKKANYTKGIGLIYNQTAAIYRQKGEFAKALDFHNKALYIWKSFQKTNPGYYYSSLILDEARTLNNMGLIYEQIGETTEALDLYLQALKIDESKDNKDGAANKIGNIGNLFLNQNQYDKALEYYFQILKIDEIVGNKERMAECYGNMGFAYWKKRDKNNAMEYYTKAVNMNESVGNKKLLSENYGNIALIYDEEKNYTQALEYYNKSVQLKKDISDNPGIAVVLGNIGAMYLDRNILPEAEKYMLNAIALSDSVGEPSTQLNNHMNLYSLYIKIGDHKKALEQFQKATSLKDSLFNQKKTEEITRKEMNYDFEKKEAVTKAEYVKQLELIEANKKLDIAEADKKRIFAEAEKKLGIAKAETRRVAAESDKEKAVSEANKKIAITEAEKKQGLAEADKRIALSNASLENQKLIRNSIIGASIAILLISFFAYRNLRNKKQREKAELSQQVSETEMKVLRSQMNPHFIFNAMQSIQTFLLSNKPEETNTYLLKFSALMRLVLDNSRYAEVTLRKDFEALELYVQLECLRLKYPFTYSFQIDENVDTENTTIPPLILQPFVENAVWHGLQHKPGGGHIDIKIIRQNEYIFCTVQDDGVGRTFAEKKQLHNMENNRSLGLKITEERLAVLNELHHTTASFQITDLLDDNNKPAGTLVTLKFPFHAND